MFTTRLIKPTAGQRWLLVTSAWQGMAEDAKRADPDHGRTFVLDAAARGRPEPDVRLATG